MERFLQLCNLRISVCNGDLSSLCTALRLSIGIPKFALQVPDGLIFLGSCAHALLLHIDEAP